MQASWIARVRRAACVCVMTQGTGLQGMVRVVGSSSCELTVVSGEFVGIVPWGLHHPGWLHWCLTRPWQAWGRPRAPRCSGVWVRVCRVGRGHAHHEK